jgi:hypothetical protein
MIRTIVCYGWEHALAAGVHLDINTHCFFEVDRLVFLGPFSVFFGGAGDGCCGVDFGGAGDGCSSVGFGGACLGSLWLDCSPGLRSLLGGEAVEFVLSGYSDCVDVFGVGK